MTRFVLLSSFIVLVWGCGSSTDVSRLNENQTVSRMQVLWQAYVRRETSGRTIQADCQPRILPAASHVPYRGAVMYLHGFTACPQQFFDLGQQLSAQGYTVLLPLMPGQGRMPPDGPQGVGDSYAELPKSTEMQRYYDFIAEMNVIMAEAPGEHIITGLSGGASLATFAAIEGQGIWDRVLLWAPYYQNNFLPEIGSILLNAFAPEYVFDRGDDCRAKRQREGGRAGICRVKVTAIRAMVDIGLMAAQRAHEIKVPVQVVGVEDDDVARNRLIQKTALRLSKSSLCFYPKGVPHALVNPRSDWPDLDPYWIPAMQEDTRAFVQKARFFPQDGPSSQEPGFFLCRV